MNTETRQTNSYLECFLLLYKNLHSNLRIPRKKKTTQNFFVIGAESVVSGTIVLPHNTG